MPKVPEGKKMLQVYLDKAVYDALYTLIKQKYSHPYGALSMEVQDALASWLHAHDETLTQTYTRINPSLPHSHLYAREIIQELKRRGFTLQCSIKDLSKVIGDVRGSDPRTARKWTKFLVKNNYLKIIRPSIFEIM